MRDFERNYGFEPLSVKPDECDHWPGPGNAPKMVGEGGTWVETGNTFSMAKYGLGTYTVVWCMRCGTLHAYDKERVDSKK